MLYQDIPSSVHAYSVSCHTRGLNDKHSHIRLLNASLRPGDRPSGLKNFKKASENTPTRTEDAISSKLHQLSDSSTGKSCHSNSSSVFKNPPSTDLISNYDKNWPEILFVQSTTNQEGVKHCSGTLWVFPSHRPATVCHLSLLSFWKELRLNWFLCQRFFVFFPLFLDLTVTTTVAITRIHIKLIYLPINLTTSKPATLKKCATDAAWAQDRCGYN